MPIDMPMPMPKYECCRCGSAFDAPKIEQIIRSNKKLEYDEVSSCCSSGFIKIDSGDRCPEGI